MKFAACISVNDAAAFSGLLYIPGVPYPANPASRITVVLGGEKLTNGPFLVRFSESRSALRISCNEPFLVRFSESRSAFLISCSVAAIRPCQPFFDKADVRRQQ